MNRCPARDEAPTTTASARRSVAIRQISGPTAGSIGVGSWEWVLVKKVVWAGRALDWVTDESPSRHYWRAARFWQLTARRPR